MKRKTHIKQLMVILPLIFGMLLAPIMSISVFADDIVYDYVINLDDQTFIDSAANPSYHIYDSDSTGAAIQVYTQDQYETFLEERIGVSSDTVIGTPISAPIYITEFLYDGAGMVVSPDLDDAIAVGDVYTPSVLDISALNIGVTGNVLISGNYTGMLAINTNDLDGDIDLYLNNVNIDTNSKKAPAIYVFNRDTTYTDHKVTIHTLANTASTVEGGKFKKVSLMDKDNLAAYASYYGGDYETYAGYYGIYTAEQIENVLFAKVQASQEDLQDGDPYYFYKGAGAISSDIDLYFEGEGYLEVTSKNKEGIETKGNLTFSGGTGDYYIFARDDALNTTTRSNAVPGAHNTLAINVRSLAAVVDSDTAAADEGDAIDSNGGIIINGGTIYALAHPTSPDDGLDSETGTVINGGTVLALGNMSDPISTSSGQNFLKVAFQNEIAANTPVVITDASGSYIAGFMTDRTFSVLTYSSNSLASNASYSISTGGVLNGEADTTTIDGTTIYTNITSYTGGTLAQTVTSNTNPGNTPPDGGGDQPTPPTPTPPAPDDGGNQPTPPTPDDGGGNNDQGGGSDNNNNNSGSNSTDDEDIPVPNTSDTTSSTVVSVPNTGRKVKNTTGVKSVPTIAWAISGCSAVTLVLYVLISRKRHAIKFRR